MSLTREQQLENAQKWASANIAKSLLFANGDYSAPTPKTMLTVGGKLRDDIFKYPIIPGAMLVYQQLVSSREWVVSGHPRAIGKLLDFFNRAQTVNTATGFVEYGFEALVKRLALDYITIGRISFAARNKQKNFVLEYLDPVSLSFERSKAFGYSSPVPENELVWRYVDNVRLSAKQVVVHHPLPVGSSGFLAPIAHILPVANLAWLLQQHDTASLDGRKIRDILVVGSPSLENAIRDAINVQIALYSGANPEEVGIPVIQVNNVSGGPIADQVTRLGISEIPEAFDRTDFTFYYVNQIAAVFGLALRHFWNDERTTNKALEVVQEQRQQQKGPASFIRTLQRLINNSGWLDHFDQGYTPRFGFIEEVDTSSLLERAEVMKRTSEALERFAKVFGAYIDPQDYFAWMQSLGVFPFELKLSGVVDEVEAMHSDLLNTIGTDAVIGPSEPLVSKTPNLSVNSNEDAEDEPKTTKPKRKFYEPMYGEIVVNSNGEILDRRVKSFSIPDAIRPHILKELKNIPDFKSI